MFTKNVIILFVECTDDEADCSKWAEVGECQKNPTFMLKSCKKSCDQCGNQIISLFCTISLHTSFMYRGVIRIYIHFRM